MIIGSMIAAPAFALIGTVYPAYATAKAIGDKESEAMARWCQYWLIFSVLSLVMPVLDFLGSFLPFYYEAKLLFVLWLCVDKFKGATFICQKYLEPFLATHQGKIDEHLDFLVARAKDFKVDDLRTLVDWAQAQANGKAVAGGVAAAKKAAAAVTEKVNEQADDKPQEPEDEPVDVSEDAKKDK